MTPKEKAEDLVDTYYWVFGDGYLGNLHIQCALIAVDEILESEPRCPSDVDWDDCGGTHQYYYEAQREEALNYWQEVKQEIEKL